MNSVDKSLDDMLKIVLAILSKPEAGTLCLCAINSLIIYIRAIQNSSALGSLWIAWLSSNYKTSDGSRDY